VSGMSAALSPPNDLTFETAAGCAMKCHEAGRAEEALLWYRRALTMRPGLSAVYNNVATLLAGLNRIDEALECYRQALAIRADYARAHAGLGALYAQTQQPMRALRHYRAYMALDPGAANVRFNVGVSLQCTGSPQEAIAAYRSGVGRLPDDDRVWSQYLLALNFDGGVAPSAVFAAHQAYGRRFPPPTQTYANARDPGRRLRVGYLSVEFRRHLGSYFVSPLLDHADRSAFEIYCYCALPTGGHDEYTAQFKRKADVWRDVVDLTDDALVKLIRDDGIDVLVDLAGHSGLNRLPALARKPAPVMITWLGYANTTGLSCMDARLVDAVTDPPGAADGLAVEPLIRMPHSFLCFQPPADAPEVAPPPLRRKGHVTFGSFNHLGKTTPQVIGLWARIVNAVPGSRLLLKDRPFDDGETRDVVRKRFEAAGLAADRIDFAGWTPDRNGHLRMYEEVDVALDPFPYNGTITSCDALWMGVPFITHAGDRHSARVGAGLMTVVGLGEFVADTPEGSVDAAVRLVGDPDRLASLRAGMRARLTASPLCDGPGFVGRLERTYRELWRRWCAAPAGRTGALPPLPGSSP
jgi:protein O-GlcNAc transferase